MLELLHAVELRLQLLERAHHVFRAGRERGPRLGGDQAPPSFRQQLLPQLGLELLQLQAHGGLGDEVFCGGGAHAAEADGGEEVSE